MSSFFNPIAPAPIEVTQIELCACKKVCSVSTSAVIPSDELSTPEAVARYAHVDEVLVKRLAAKTKKATA